MVTLDKQERMNRQRLLPAWLSRNARGIERAERRLGALHERRKRLLAEAAELGVEVN